MFTVAAGEKAGNLDYIELTTDAALTNALTEQSEGVFKHVDGWVEHAKPTAAAEGLLLKGCPVCKTTVAADTAEESQKTVLPALNKTDYTYTLVKEATATEDGEETYTYTKDGATFTYTVILPATGVVSEIEPVWVGSSLFGTLNFFDPTHWTEGKQPESDATDGSLKITGNARIDYLGKYVEGVKRNSSHNDTENDVLTGEEIVYSMQIKSTGDFGIMLFATGSAGWNSTKNRSMRFHFINGGKIQITNGNSGSSVGAVSQASYSFTDYTRLDFAIVRNSATEVEVKTYVNGRRVIFEAPEGNSGGNISADKNFKCSPNGYGGNIEFVSLSGSVINVTTPTDSRYKEEEAPGTDTPGTDTPGTDAPGGETGGEA